MQVCSINETWVKVIQYPPKKQKRKGRERRKIEQEILISENSFVITVFLLTEKNFIRVCDTDTYHTMHNNLSSEAEEL